MSAEVDRLPDSSTLLDSGQRKRVAVFKRNGGRY